MARSPGILIVDQDPETRYQIERLVPETGFVVAGQAGPGTEAVALATEREPDIVLCAVREPALRAVQTIESIAHTLPYTTVIAYADSGGLETVRNAMRAGARDFLQLPIKPDDLRRAIAAALDSEERRHLRQTSGTLLGPRGTVITVFGPKGGVGKTAISSNLAVALAERSEQHVVLVDADSSFGDAATTLALKAEHTIVDAVRATAGEGETHDLKELLSYHDSGLAVLAAPASPFDWQGVSGEALARVVQELSRVFDTVIIDTGSNLSEVSQAALTSASLVLWVTTPDFSSVRDSLAGLRALQTLRVPPERVRLMLNVVSPEMDVQPSSIEEALGHTIFWSVPYDRLLRQSGQLGRPLIHEHPKSRAAMSLTGLARFLGATSEPPQSNGGGGLLRRIFTRDDRPEHGPAEQLAAEEA